MKKRIMIGGFGGQGVMLAGQVLCYSAMEANKAGVTFFPSYGTEQRGGTANCFVVISDDPVGAPIPQEVDDFIAFNDAALAKFEGKVCPGGSIFLNSSVVKGEPERSDIQVVKVPATEIAVGLGSARSQNLVMLGAYLGYTRLVDMDSAQTIVEKKLGKKRPQMVPINRQALSEGYEIGNRALLETERGRGR